MISAQLGLILVLCVSCAFSGSTPPQGCMRNGVHYNAGAAFKPTPCEHCHCTWSGQVLCAVADCFFVPCVDSVHDPSQCCPLCPNGHNCKHSDGTIIKQGEVYKPDPYTTCECPQNTFGMRGSMAFCVAQAQTAIAPIVH